MPFSSQFALPLEVTRLLPISKAADAIMSLARSLQKSGSSIVIEEDLSFLFGRCRLSPKLESSFKTVMKESSKNLFKPLSESLMLQAGFGPTVARALNQPHYLSTVVQLSLLAWVHDSNSLAEAIVEVLDRRIASAPKDVLLESAPAQEDIAKVVCACEEQTSGFDWNKLLMPIACVLDLDGQPGARVRLDEVAAQERISSVVFRGLIEMAPLAQTFSEDNLIHIETATGTCILVVWIHIVLGLNVMVKREGKEEHRFGDGPEQVTIEVTNDFTRSAITLLDAAGDIQFRMQSEADSFDIDGANKIFAKGYGRKMLIECCDHIATIEETELIITAVAKLVAKQLAKVTPIDRGSHAQREPIQDSSIFKAAQFLFDRSDIDYTSLRPFEVRYMTGLRDSAPIPASLKALHEAVLGQAESYAPQVWNALLGHARCLVVLLLSLTQVSVLDDCERLPLRGSTTLYGHPITNQLHEWDGKSIILVEDDTWFKGIALPLVGDLSNPCLDVVGLLSSRGWSVFFTTFGQNDPATLIPGAISVAHGVPCRNEVRKRGVIDGPRSGLMVTPDSYAVAEELGQTSKLRCDNVLDRLPTMCAERNEFFAASLRLMHSRADKKFLRRSGFRELHRAVWAAEKSQSCPHSVKSKLEIDLPVGVMTVTGFPHERAVKNCGHRIVVYLTAFDSSARWRALVQAAGSSEYQILLRTEACCYSCVVNQALIRPDKWFIVL